MTNDEQLLASLVDPAATRPRAIVAGESRSMRLLVLVLAPLWITAIVLAVSARLLRGRRPLLVMHERVGYGRTALWVPKIATAQVASNERRFAGLVERASGPPVELEVERPVEQWLRATGVDELPQLFLVVAGQMRLVGPRPVTPSEMAEMANHDHEVGVDHLQPGIVGLWQVLDRHGYELAERRDLDLLMINNWSPRLRRDLLVLSIRQAVERVRSR